MKRREVATEKFRCFIEGNRESKSGSLDIGAVYDIQSRAEKDNVLTEGRWPEKW